METILSLHDKKEEVEMEIDRELMERNSDYFRNLAPSGKHISIEVEDARNYALVITLMHEGILESELEKMDCIHALNLMVICLVLGVNISYKRILLGLKEIKGASCIELFFTIAYALPQEVDSSILHFLANKLSLEDLQYVPSEYQEFINLIMNNKLIVAGVKGLSLFDPPQWRHLERIDGDVLKISISSDLSTYGYSVGNEVKIRDMKSHEILTSYTVEDLLDFSLQGERVVILTVGFIIIYYLDKEEEKFPAPFGASGVFLTLEGEFYLSTETEFFIITRQEKERLEIKVLSMESSQDMIVALSKGKVFFIDSNNWSIGEIKVDDKTRCITTSRYREELILASYKERDGVFVKVKNLATNGEREIKLPFHERPLDIQYSSDEKLVYVLLANGFLLSIDLEEKSIVTISHDVSSFASIR